MQFKFFSELAGGGSFGGFSSGFCEEDVWFEFEDANTKQQGETKC